MKGKGKAFFIILAIFSALFFITNVSQAAITPECPTPTDYTYNSTNSKCESNPSCPNGTYDAAVNYCKADATYTCPSGYSYNSSAYQCQMDPQCPNGNYDAAVNYCKTNATFTCSSSQYTWNQTTFRCEHEPTCPCGGTYNAESGNCEAGFWPCPCDYSTGNVTNGICIRYPICPDSGYIIGLGNNQKMCSIQVIITCPQDYTYVSPMKICTKSVACTNGGSLRGDLDKCTKSPTITCPQDYTYVSPMKICTKSVACTNGGSLRGDLDKCQINPYPITDVNSNDKCTTECNEDCIAKPVSVASGTVYVAETDFTINGIMPIAFTRYHNSKIAQNMTFAGMFGYTWTSSFDATVQSYTGNLYKIINPDGSITYYADPNGDKTYEADFPRGENSKLIKNTDNTFKRIYKDGSSEEFNTSGYMTAMVDKNNNRLTLTRDTGGKLTKITDPAGREINITYNTSTWAIQITLPDGKVITYTRVSGNLQKVTYPDGTYKTYEYSSYKLTGIKNEKGNYIEKHTYDAQGRGITSSADGTNDLLTINYTNDTQTTVTDSLGRTTTYTYDKSKGKGHLISRTGPGCQSCGQGNVAYTYDDKLHITTETDAIGNITAYTYDASASGGGNLLTKTEASGTSLQRTTTYTYNSQNDLIEQTDPKGTKTQYQYDAKRNLIKILNLNSQLQTLNSITFTRNTKGQITQVIDNQNNTTNIAYDTYGNIASTTDALNNATTYTYDIMGKPLTATDANGKTTTLTYDQRARLKNITLPDGGITAYEYDPAGNTTSITDPINNKITNLYDNINRLIKITDPELNNINYTYDSQNNKLTTTIKDNLSNITTSSAYTYNDQNSLIKTTHPDTTYTEQTYDPNGNIITKKDENGNIYTYTYDSLNRLTKVIDPLGGNTNYTYDTNNNLKTVTDAKGNTTTYVYDALNRLTSTQSPDTGTTTYTYDSIGNLKTKTDANNTTTIYYYDALNRLIFIQFPDEYQNIAYTYDTCANGKGRLCIMQDQSGATYYTYNSIGQLTSETKTINSINYLTEYTYDLSGNLTTIKYPSGRTIIYNYTNNKITAVQNNAQTIATNITYKPFGPIKTLTYGNNLQQTVAYDQRYRTTSITTAIIQNLVYQYNPNGNITAITNNLDPTKNKTYAYDTLNRLTAANGPWGTIQYAYDQVGNRQTETTSTGTTNYTYTANKLASSTGEKTFTFNYDNNGNTIVENQKQYIYNQNQRLINTVENGVTTSAYIYNGNGQRTGKATTAGTTIFHYDLNGQLIAESTATGSIIAEYVYLYSQPIAKIDSSGVQYIHNDHLGTPMIMTNINGAKVWEIQTKPFGDGATITGTATLNLRFPGQYFDSETGNNYNYFRDYNSQTGRYIESDVIGLLGGINLFTYARVNPASFIDPMGLADNSTPWSVGWEWLTGTGQKERYFEADDPFTELLKQHSHIQDVRNDAIKRLENCEKNIPSVDMPYTLSGVKGVPKFLNDYSTLSTGGATGNLAATYLGSYNLTYDVTNVNWGTRTATVNFSVENASSISSATHPPVIGYTTLWNKYVGNPLNNLFSTGPMSKKIQYFNWNETINFNPCKCGN